MLEGSTSSRSTARENEMSRWVETLEALDKGIRTLLTALGAARFSVTSHF